MDNTIVCGLSPEGCAKLRSELQQCVSAPTEWFTMFVATDQTGAITQPCLAVPASQAHVDCAAEAMKRAGPVADPGLTRVPLRLGVNPMRVYLPDGNGLSTKAVIETVRAAIPDIVRCLEAQRAQEPNLHGKLVYEWDVAPDGRVTRVELLSKDLAAAPAMVCIRDLISRLQFPSGQSAYSEPIVMPFKF